MLYVLHGEDVKKGREKLHALVGNLVAKKPDASKLHITNETFNAESLDELIYGQGLFEQKQIIVLDRLFVDKEIKDVIVKRLTDIVASENIFVLFEGKIDKTTLTKLEKKAEKVQAVSTKVAQEKKRPFDIFSLTDALGRRDKKTLWVLYMKAKQAGVSDEEVHGILFWQVKSMLLSGSAESAKDAGLNPFVYRKAGAFLKNYNKQELQSLSQSLINLSHNARRGMHEFDTALERFILSV